MYNSALQETGYTDEIKVEELPQQQIKRINPEIEKPFGLILPTAIV